jgi:hypothetical protein
VRKPNLVFALGLSVHFYHGRFVDPVLERLPEAGV